MLNEITVTMFLIYPTVFTTEALITVLKRMPAILLLRSSNLLRLYS